MRSVLVLMLATSSCMGFNIIPTTDDSSGGTGHDSGAADSTTADAGDGGVQGINCGVDPDTGDTLCLGISTCPSLTVDQDTFPGCGFRIHSDPAVIDLECACYGQICPIGVATTCDQAKALMMGQSQYTVCLQIQDNRCTTM